MMLIHPPLKVLDGHRIQVSTTRLSRFFIKHGFLKYKKWLKRRFPNHKIIYDYENVDDLGLQFFTDTPKKLYIAYVYRVDYKVQFHRVGMFNSKEDAEKAIENNCRKFICDRQGTKLPFYYKAVIEEVKIGRICDKVTGDIYKSVWYYTLERQELDAKQNLFDYQYVPSHFDSEFPIYCLLCGSCAKE